ncbi:MAG: 4-alpha-glucanotransferase, partial [Thermomicrobiales bacterium]|nr:4-alpha-glucanotransferase [Thermomicrobiales bacterium]
PNGIGELGSAAYRFVDWLEQAGITAWQIMPLTPTGFGDSPYASPSAFAGNVLLISLPWLAGDGLLESHTLSSLAPLPESHVDFDAVRALKMPLLREAFGRFRRGAASHLRPEFEAYQANQASWLDDYALFMALKDAHGGAAWNTWPSDLVHRDPAALEAASQAHRDDVAFHRFAQFLCDRQWQEVHRYANDRGVQVIGDIPIFVAYDSADVWANQPLFRLNPDGLPSDVAGVPPDAFTSHGQLWGNPAYDWQRHEETGFSWWIERVRATLQRVDLLRIDHFRGFAASWVVPATAETAASGHWEPGPGRSIFDAIERALGSTPFIVEDLGLITPDVVALRESLGLPGMRVLQFAFGDGPGNAYLPHNYDPLTVTYTGTHDNQTSIGWFRGLDDQTRSHVQRYLGRDGSDIAWDLIRLASSSVADRALAPLQDVMRLDDSARMNTPGRAEGNWDWRFAPHQLHEGLADGLRDLTETYGRITTSDIRRGYDPYDYMAPSTAHPLMAPATRGSTT